MSEDGWQTRELTPAQGELQEETIDAVIKHHQDVTPSETVAILANVIGRVIAMMSPGDVSDAGLDELIMRNVRYGNEQVRDVDTNTPLIHLKPEGNC